ncbi:MAG: hypothetical protein AB1427_21095 [Thermodesulfobacteriota bacterium]
MKNLIKEIQKRVKGILLLAMLVIPFFLYKAAGSGSTGAVYFFLVLMTGSMLAAMRSA